MPHPARPDYGIDAPGLMRSFLIAGCGAVALAIVAHTFRNAQPMLAVIVMALFSLAAFYFCGMGLFMIRESKIGKVVGREVILDHVAWRGDETVLDVGCGRGLMLIGAAQRLRTGSAVGIDIWQASDQSGNHPDAAQNNATLAGVSDRISVKTADMRAIPFAHASFDVVMSHWVVHNLETMADRTLALAEMVRVLVPGGTLILVDIANRGEYCQTLHDLGLRDLRIVVRPIRDAVLGAVSFGSFRPAAIIATRPK